MIYVSVCITLILPVIYNVKCVYSIKDKTVHKRNSKFYVHIFLKEKDVRPRNKITKC